MMGATTRYVEKNSITTGMNVGTWNTATISTGFIRSHTGYDLRPSAATISTTFIRSHTGYDLRPSIGLWSTTSPVGPLLPEIHGRGEDRDRGRSPAVIVRRNSNPKTLGSIPWRQGEGPSCFSIPPSQLFVQTCFCPTPHPPSCVWHAPKFVRTLENPYPSVVKE